MLFYFVSIALGSLQIASFFRVCKQYGLLPCFECFLAIFGPKMSGMQTVLYEA